MFRRKIKLNKRFLRILARRKWGQVGDVIKNMDFLVIEGNAIQNLHKEYEKVESIFLTVYFLLQNDLVTTDSKHSNVPDFNPNRFKDEDGYLLERLIYINKLIKEYWDLEIHITPNFYPFLYNGFKTDKEIREQKQLWLAVGVAVLASFLTALFTTFLPSIFGI